MQGNGLDLGLFQFDYDMSFAVFFLNADRTIYGRYGSRSRPSKDAHLDISMTGLAEAMKATLRLHAGYPGNRDALAAKTGPSPPYPVPEKMPTLSGQYQPELARGDSEAISQSCLHCHQIHQAERAGFLRRGEPIPTGVMFPWPMPEVVGLDLDRASRATLRSVAPGSPAAKAGLQAADELLSLNGQPLVSIADVQWVLHRAGDTATLDAVIRRDGGTHTRTVELPRGWRKESDISWRTSSWEYRRIALGGMQLESLPPEERAGRGLSADRMALRAEYVGQWGKYALARRSGFEKDDLVISFDGHDEAWKEQDLFFHVLRSRKKGDEIPVTVLRGDREIELKLTVQD